MMLVYKVWQKKEDTQKDKGNDSFVNLVVTKNDL